MPCARSLMAELQAAVDGRPSPRDVQYERVFAIADIVDALKPRKSAAGYRGRRGGEVDLIYASQPACGAPMSPTI